MGNIIVSVRGGSCIVLLVRAIGILYDNSNIIDPI